MTIPLLTPEESEQLKEGQMALLKLFQDFMRHPMLPLLQAFAEEREHQEREFLGENDDLTPKQEARTRANIKMLKDIADGRFYQTAYRRERERLRNQYLGAAKLRQIQSGAAAGANHAGGRPRGRPLA